MPQVKIIHCIYDDVENPWLGGGGAYRLMQIYKRFPKNADITIITANFPGAKSKVNGKIKILRVGCGYNYLMSRLSYSIFAASALLKCKADVIVEDFSPYSPCFSIFLKKRNIVLFQNFFLSHFFKTRGVIGIIPWLCENIYMRKTKFAIVVSQKLRKLLSKFNDNCSIAVIPCGVDEEYFKLPFKDHGYILFLGRIDIYQKGLDVLLLAFSSVVGQLSNTRLVIAGSGKDLPKLKKLIAQLEIEEKVDLIGKVEGTHKMQVITNATYVCIPSRFEAWPIVPAEMMASGKPIIATNIEGLDEVVDEKTAIIIPPDDPEALANAMLRLARDKKLRRELGRRAREKAREFDWDKRAQATWEFYKKFMEAAKRR